MTHTIEDIARLCGCRPEEKPRLWNRICNCGKPMTWSGPIDQWKCVDSRCECEAFRWLFWVDRRDSDLFAFQHVRPVLLAAGCVIEDDGSRAGERDVFVYKGVELLVECAEYSHALFAALLRLHNDAPAVLAEAVAKVKEGAR